MGKFLKSVKKNKVLLVLAIVLIVCFVLIFYVLLKYFYTGAGSTKYGDRLDGLIEIHSSYKDEISELYKDTTSVNKTTINVEGKIIYINIDFKEALSIKDAKSVAIKSLDIFSDEEKSSYDIQFILTASEVETDLFPIMGYKNKNNTKVVW